MASAYETAKECLLFQDDVLRMLLGQLAGAAHRTLRGEPAAQELRDLGLTVEVSLEGHFGNEERLLPPLLTASRDRETIERFRSEHRRTLGLLATLRQLPPEVFARACERLVPRLLAAISREENDLFGTWGSWPGREPLPATKRTLELPAGALRRSPGRQRSFRA